MYKNETLAYLDIPKIPQKEWDRQTPFKNGVGIAKTNVGEVYVVVGYSEDDENNLKIRKVFGLEPIIEITKVYPIPDYMDMNGIENWDVDDESKQNAMAVAKEVIEMENEQEEEQKEEYKEWFFDEIHNLEEARAWVAAYRKRNRIKGTPPKTEDAIKNYLYVLYKNQKRGI